ncbi:MAG: VOC family protein [Acidimicrobiales bacterium]|nr:VOC family protein [Acidimicrobiales bacterium]
MTADLEPRLDVVVFGVRDLPTVRDFYTRLGWRHRPKDGMFARFELGATAMVLFPLDTLADVVGVPTAEGRGFSGTATAMQAASPEAIDEALDTVVAAGGTVLAQAADRPWGVRTAYFADPEDNVWELFCLPPRPGAQQ